MQSTTSVQLGESGNGFRRISSNLNPNACAIPEDSVAVDTSSHPLGDHMAAHVISNSDPCCNDQCVNNVLAFISDPDSNDVKLQEMEFTDRCVQSKAHVCTACADRAQCSCNDTKANNCSSASSSADRTTETQHCDDEDAPAAAENESNNAVKDLCINEDSAVLTRVRNMNLRPMRVTSKTSLEELTKIGVKIRETEHTKYNTLDLHKRWSSTCFDAGNLSKDGCPSTNKADSGTGSLESRRSLSECSLAENRMRGNHLGGKALQRGQGHSSSVGNKLDDGSSVISTESEGRSCFG